MSRFRKIVRWVPLGCGVATIVATIVCLALGGMTGVTAWIVLQTLVPLLSALTLLVVALYGLIRRRASAPVVATLVMSLVGSLPILWMFGIGLTAYPASTEGTRPHLVARLPSNEPLLTFWGGDAIDRNYHAMSADQRWAYDFAVDPVLAGSSQPEDYGCWGTEIVAPISGEAAVVRDGLPDATPPELSNDIENATGNHVAILTEHGTYLIIAHMKNGSVRVRAGEQVEEGQVIGLCGNSGNTSEPHIHVHHQRQDPSRYPISFAEGLPLFFRDHDGPPMPVGGVAIDGEVVTPTGDRVRHVGSP